MTTHAHLPASPSQTTGIRFRQILFAAGLLVVRTVKGFHWYLKEVMGENAYIHYLESHRRRHGTEEGAMGKREFWKDLTDEQDRNPRARCC